MPQPTKEQVKRWIDERARERKPLPSRKEIRRQLGWDLVEMARQQNSRS